MTAPAPVFRDHQKATCTVCEGPITFYARRKDEPQPRTTSVDDSDRWAHDEAEDWLNHPHRATPQLNRVA